MIKVDFDPAQIAGSLLLSVDDLKHAAGLAVKLRDGYDPLAPHLEGVLSRETRQALREYDAAQPLNDSLRDTLLSVLNQLLQGAPLYDRAQFRGMVWRKERATLMKALIKQIEALIEEDPKRAEGLVCFNRLLLEEIYPDEIVNSPKAEWEAWTLLAARAKERVIEQWEAWKHQRAEWKKTREGDAPVFKPVLQDDVWKGFRDWLKKNVFNNKCAYCESRITGFPGDTEHFRPKGRVRRVDLEDETSEIVKVIDEEGEEIPHPGYFWLAYNWQNLLPSCEFCNTAGGKSDVFPVENSHVAVRRLTVSEMDDLLDRITQSPETPDIFYLEPRDLDRYEGRLLLHPYYDNPEDHIFFDVEGRAAIWNDSAKGKWSYKVYNLDEASKLAARRQEQDLARGRYMSLMGSTDDDPSELKKAAQKFMDTYYRGTLPYAAAVFDFIHDRLERTRYDPAALLGERRKKV